MSSPRPRATLADYVVVGISPTLIGFLVGSLVFFLSEVLYQGNFEGRLNVILALFVMATVCVARISMEEGSAHAALFAAPLALVTLIAMNRFVQISGPLASLSLPINVGFIALKSVTSACSNGGRTRRSRAIRSSSPSSSIPRACGSTTSSAGSTPASASPIALKPIMPS